VWRGVWKRRKRERFEVVGGVLCVWVGGGGGGWGGGWGGGGGGGLGHLVSGDNDTVTSPFTEISWHYSPSLTSLKVLGRGE